MTSQNHPILYATAAVVCCLILKSPSAYGMHLPHLRRYVGYALTTKWEGSDERMQVIGFDMGGTSTDVSRFAGSYEHVFESTTAGEPYLLGPLAASSGYCLPTNVFTAQQSCHGSSAIFLRSERQPVVSLCVHMWKLQILAVCASANLRQPDCMSCFANHSLLALQASRSRRHSWTSTRSRPAAGRACSSGKASSRCACFG